MKPRFLLLLFALSMSIGLSGKTYTAYDRPGTISQGVKTATFSYNAGYDRVRMQISTSGEEDVIHYYIGDRYEITVDMEGLMTTENFYLGGDAYSAPMVMQRFGYVSWTKYLLGRDYLGSITHIASPDGTLVAEYSYDAWGRLRDPATNVAYSASSQPFLLLGRGYCGHEHIREFGLINMNARLYDPVLGRFLSPDPYVQAPDIPGNFNRYSYCLNNPLKYVDESGQFFFADSFIFGLVHGGWKEAFKRAKNDARLWGGLFVTDNNKFLVDRVKELVSRFTVQLSQTVLGFVAAQATNTWHLAGGVNYVEYLHGATVTTTNDGGWGAFTLGNFITGGNELQAANENEYFQHEYGHYLQSQALGPLYVAKVAIPSILSKDPNTHKHNPVEQDANIRAFNYFKKYYRKDFDFFDIFTGEYKGAWLRRDDQNPIDGMLWSFYYSSPNNSLLSNYPISFHWSDIFALANLQYGFIIQGIINALYNNTRY